MLQALRVGQYQVSGASTREDLHALPRRAADAASIHQLMSQQLDIAKPASDAEALRLLRQIFPGAPLSVRVAALARRRAE